MTTIQTPHLSLENISVKERKLNLLSQNLYSIRIEFNGLSLKKSLIDWDNLNLDEESKLSLQQSKAKISAIPLFDKLEESASQLKKLRREIYTYTIVSEGQRVTTDSRIGIVLEKTNHLYQEAKRLKEKLESHKEEGLQTLLDTVRNFYQTPVFQLLPSEIEDRLAETARLFESSVEINKLLEVEVNIECYKSLEQQLEESSKLSQQIARRQNARNAEAEAFALKRIQQQQRESLEKFQSQIFEDVRREIAEILAVQIDNLRKFDIDKNNALIKNKLQVHLERLTTLAEFDFDGSFVSAKKGLKNLALAWGDRRRGDRDLLIELDLLKADLNQKLAAINKEEARPIEFCQLYYD